ncbi:MAG: hypothetical protein ABL921_01110 [Pirellula sp.]
MLIQPYRLDELHSHIDIDIDVGLRISMRGLPLSRGSRAGFLSPNAIGRPAGSKAPT